MLISHKHKFVFIAVPKTASETIRTCLNDFSNIDQGHLTTGQVKKYFGEQGWDWDSYFKFAFVRNPWDWVVSWYSYRKNVSNANNTQNIKFKEWLVDETSTAYNTSGLGLSISQFEFLSELDFIGSFENLQEDFNFICDKVGVPRQELAHKNKSTHKHYSEYYDEETKQFIAERFAREIETFGYKFNVRSPLSIG